VKFLCDQCKTKYQIADEKAVGKTLRMKCRKCGHLIEVRAAAAVTGSSAPPPGHAPHAPVSPGAPAPPRPMAKPAAAPLASNLAATKPPVKSEKPPASALAGAFKSTVRDEEVSAPFDMSDLGGANDEWYVAVNGVPVGPIRVAEIRRKAANGAVTEDSLAWQEGLDEWRPVRTFPDLAAVVREAIASGRPSLTPLPPEGRPSLTPSSRTGGARASIGPQPGRPAPPARHPQGGIEQAAARSNVVPINSRLATAEKLAADDLTVPYIHEQPAPEAGVVADPFAAPPAPRPAPASLAPGESLTSIPPRRRSKQFPWVPVAMASCVGFGLMSGYVAFSRPAPTQQIIYQQVAPTADPSAGVTTAPTENAAPDTAPSATKVASNGKSGSGGGSAAAASTASAAAGPSKPGGLDLSSLRGGRVTPMGADGENAPGPGQCLSAGMVQNVVMAKQLAMRRQCWDRNPGNKPAANVTLSMTVGPDGSPGSISASGDDPSVASCIQSEAKSWKFPAMGCSQPISVPFHFVRQ
jgi:predicted Zn finger-like uncharacterized protein